jgi:signal recognition particle GTPase
MTDFTSFSASELANRIAILRDNLRQLTEQAAAQSGAANEERLANRIETQSKELEDLLKEQERRG